MVVALDATSEVLNTSEGEIFCHLLNVSYRTWYLTKCFETEYGTFVVNKVDIGSKTFSGEF
jgi:hypothetical protein